MRTLLTCLCAVAFAPALPTQNAVLQWSDAALAAIRATNTPPPRAARSLAILHGAIFDAANGIQPRFHEYLVPPAAPVPSNRIAAVATAGHDVLAALFPTQAASFVVVRDSLLGGLASNPAKVNGMAWGSSVAQQILLARANDGSTAVVPYPGSTAPGMWRPTVSFGGNVLPALLPQWGNVTTFGISAGSVATLQPPPPPALQSWGYALEVGYTQAIGGTVSSWRTAEQTEIARFWGYGPGTATPPGHWNQIAHNVARQRHVNLLDSARLFALMNFALADAAIVCWRCKYDAGLWRPITAIQLADQDGNPLTHPNPTWTPLLPTPPFPEYTSGHSSFSGAAARVLARFFGTDQVSFTSPSDDLPGVTRSYQRFSQAALESGMSRIYGGIHFLSGNVYGLINGNQIGQQIYDSKLTRLP